MYEIQATGNISSYREGSTNSKGSNVPTNFKLVTDGLIYNCITWEHSFMNNMKISCKLIKLNDYKGKTSYKVDSATPVVVENIEIEQTNRENFIKTCKYTINYKGIGDAKIGNIFDVISKYGNVEYILDEIKDNGSKKQEIFECICKSKKLSINLDYFNLVIDECVSIRRETFLRSLGLKNKELMNIRTNSYSKFMEKIRTNPFRVHNLSIDVCVKICKLFNIPYDNDDIKVANISREMRRLEKNEYITRVNISNFSNLNVERMEKKFENHGIMLLDNYLTFRDVYEAEKTLAHTFIRLLSSVPNKDYELLDEALNNREIKNKWNELLNKQRNAVVMAMSNNLTCITGGAGTGKTYVIGMLAMIFEFYNIEYMCLAYAGKAVSNLKQSLHQYIGEKKHDRTSTIHRILHNIKNEEVTDTIYIQSSNYDESEEDDNHCGSIKVDKKLDYLIIEEASMPSGQLISKLLKCYQDIKIIFVGDRNQLPPFGGWGQPFNILIKNRVGAIIELTENKRSIKELVEYSEKAKNGDFRNILDINDACLKVEVGDLNKILNIYEKLISENYENRNKIKVICATNNQVAEINKKIQKLNDNQFITNQALFKLYDWIVIRKNNYSDNLMNGQEGLIIGIEIYYDCSGIDICKCGLNCQSVITYYCQFEERKNDIFQMKQIKKLLFSKTTSKEIKVSLGYSLTIHRSQGSGWDIVLLYVDNAWNVTRNHLYTGITRAKNKLYIITKNSKFVDEISDHISLIPSSWFEDFINDKYISEGQTSLIEFSKYEKTANEELEDFRPPKYVNNSNYRTQVTNEEGQIYDAVYSFECIDDLNISYKFKIIIEYDGCQHFSNNVYQNEMDIKKFRYIWNNSDSLLRFRNTDDLNDILLKTIYGIASGYRVYYEIYEDSYRVIIRNLRDESVKILTPLEYKSTNENILFLE